VLCSVVVLFVVNTFGSLWFVCHLCLLHIDRAIYRFVMAHRNDRNKQVKSDAKYV
jgi:hypothetical protein